MICFKGSYQGGENTPEEGELTLSLVEETGGITAGLVFFLAFPHTVACWAAAMQLQFLESVS